MAFSRRKKKPGQDTGDVALNITAMADIFTIILVFLLKSFSSSAVAVTPTQGLMLPTADAPDPQYEALTLEIAENGVLVEGNPSAKLDGFRFSTNEVGANGVPKTLGAALGKERKRQLLLAQTNPAIKVDSKVMIVADKRTPYVTLKAVLAAAAVNGFTDFKMIVAKNE